MENVHFYPCGTTKEGMILSAVHLDLKPGANPTEDK